MKAGRALDSKIAIKIMGVKKIIPEKISHYSTDIYAAHKVISKMQLIGWYCSVSSRITTDGNLFYRVRFYQNDRECEQYANTIPLAVCIAALAVMKNEYFEYVDVLEKIKNDDTPIDIIGDSKNTFSKVELFDDVLLETIKDAIEAFKLSDKNSENIAINIIDYLRNKGYTISKSKIIE